MIAYIVYLFYDQSLFCLVAMATLNLKKMLFFFIIIITSPPKPLKQYDSNFVEMGKIILLK